jgi:hypothetical protein
MAAPPISKYAAQAALDAHTKYGSIEGAARGVGLPSSTFRNRYRAALNHGWHGNERTKSTHTINI